MLFYPRANDPELRVHWRWRRIEIPSGNHVLEGWWAEAGAPDSDLTLVYFGGNAEDVLLAARNAGRMAAKRMLVVNYRGYGGTKGKPTQQALFEDALAIYDYVRGPGGAAPTSIVLIGRSLGSGVATWLATQREVRAAVLITPFDSIRAVAARRFPAIIVDLLLRHPFPSAEMAPRAKVPALFLIAAEDAVIAPAHAYALAEAWGGSTQIRAFAGAGHNDIDLHPDYHVTLDEFLQSLP
jgi:pimeloyl-ACP methyl ester carboxylesterase